MDNNDNNNRFYDFDSEERSAEEVTEERRRRRAELKRRRIRNSRIFYGCILAVLILVIVLIVRGCSGDDTPGEGGAAVTNANTGLVSLPTAPARPEGGSGADESEDGSPAAPGSVALTLTAVGDIMIYDEQIADARDGSDYDFSHCFADLADELSAGDITVGNLETTLSGGPDYQGRPDFNAPETLADNLSAVGFDLLQTANTYSLQHGIAGLYSTIKFVTSAQMQSVGTYYSQENRDENGGAVIREINGVKIAFISYTKGTNGIIVPEEHEYSTNLLYTDYLDYFSKINEDVILDDLEAVRAQEPDLIVALMHWGSEWSSTQSDSQEEAADLLFENGVDIILGTHSHVIQPMEKRTVTTTDGEEKEVFVAFSLGNFIAYQPDREHANESLILNIQINKDDETGEVSIGDFSYIPVYIEDRGEGSSERFRVISIHEYIDAYESGSADDVDASLYDKLKTALNNIHDLAGSRNDYVNAATPVAAPPSAGPSASPAPGDGDPGDAETPPDAEATPIVINP